MNIQPEHDDQHELGQVEGTEPVLLSGVYRSGTTFLAAVVNSIPNIAAASSTVKYLRFCLPHFTQLDRGAVLDQMLSEIRVRISKRWSLELDVEKVKMDLGAGNRNHARVYDAVMRALLLEGGDGATRWAEKINVQWRDIPLFLKMFPKGKVIHVFRDPRDVTASYKKMTYEPWPTFMDAALNSKAAMQDLPEFVEGYGKDRILVVRAEDLATDLSQQLRTICQFLGEPFDPSMADTDRFGSLKGEEWRTNTSFEDSTANYTQAKKRWHDHLSAEELFLTEMICQPEMSHFGYEGSGQDLASLNGMALEEILSDAWFGPRLSNVLRTGRPLPGYRTDPYETEMNIVFGDKEG